MLKHRKVFQPKPRHTCSGKNCYDSKSEAEMVKVEQELLTRDLRLDVYRCTNCKSWHLTRAEHSGE